VAVGDLMPDLTIMLDIPVEIGMARARKRRGTAAPDRFEGEDPHFTRNCVTPISRSPPKSRSAAR
jgi:dTMP kinase